MELQVIILAAGKGSRMKSELPKVLHHLAGKPLVQHVVDTCKSLGATSLNLVIGHGAEEVKRQIDDRGMPINWIEQKTQEGTGHAVKMALPKLKPNTPTLILYGDVPLTHQDTLSLLVDAHKEHKALVVMTIDLPDPTGYGRILRDEQGNITGIIEHKDASEKQRQITEVNTGILCANSDQLVQWVNRIDNKNAQQEYYLTDIIGFAVEEGHPVISAQPRNQYEVEGINTLAQLAELERSWQLQMASELMAAGVTIRDPYRFDLRGKLTCESDVQIDINCIFEGTVLLKKGAKIGPNCLLKDCTIGEQAIVKANSVIEGATLGPGCSAGPFARLRPGAELVEDSHVGNFVEIKNASLGKGSKAGHLSYLGDAVIGEQVNIGAGTITCNYDGANKHQTLIGDHAFIGSDTQLVAPVKIGRNVTVGAGTTVTSDVEDNQLCISRVKQKHIDGWQRPTKKSKGD